MNSPILSFIIPIYNVEIHLLQCLNSLINQGISYDNYEIICINDCSPDNSRNIVIDFQKKHKNIVLIDHEKNQKVGGARNTGIKAAKGKFIWFVDSDDFIRENSLGQLLNICKNNNLDMLAFNITTVTNAGKIISHENAFKEISTPISGAELLNKSFENTIIHHLGYPYRAIISRDLINKIDAKFPVQISYGEDTSYIARCLLYANYVISLSDSYYYYRQNPLSVTANLETKFSGHLLFQSIFEAGKLVLDLYAESRLINNQLANNISTGIPWFVNRLFIRLLRTSTKEQIVFFKEVNKKKLLVKSILPYMNNVNYFIVKFCILGLVIINIIRPIYLIKRKIQNARKPKQVWCY